MFVTADAKSIILCMSEDRTLFHTDIGEDTAMSLAVAADAIRQACETIEMSPVAKTIGDRMAFIEAVYSSRIENVEAPIWDLIAAEKGQSEAITTEDGRWVESALKGCLMESELPSDYPKKQAWLELHRTLGCEARDQKNWGHIRTHNVRIADESGNTVYSPPAYYEVEKLADQLCDAKWHTPEWMSSRMKGLAVAAAEHKKFESIHPFHDGNGRVGRMLFQRKLREYGILPPCLTLPFSVYIYKHRFDYYSALSKESHDMIAEMFARAGIEAARIAKNAAKFFVCHPDEMLSDVSYIGAHQMERMFWRIPQRLR